MKSTFIALLVALLLITACSTPENTTTTSTDPGLIGSAGQFVPGDLVWNGDKCGIVQEITEDGLLQVQDTPNPRALQTMDPRDVTVVPLCPPRIEGPNPGDRIEVEPGFQAGASPDLKRGDWIKLSPETLSIYPEAADWCAQVIRVEGKEVIYRHPESEARRAEQSTELKNVRLVQNCNE